MLVELVRTTTRDGLRLNGSLATPRDKREHGTTEALVLLHGVGGTFYTGALFDALTDRLLECGIAVLRVNTRGHGAVSLIAASEGTARGGAAFEVVDACRHDVTAWLDFLSQRGLTRLGVLGHSLGAIKAVHAQVHDPHPNVRCVVAISPPRLSHSAFLNGERSTDYLQSLSEAKLHVREGQGDKLLTVQFPVPLLISAASFLDKYGGERYNVLPLVDRVHCPTLFTYGSLELEGGDVAFAGLPESIRAACREGQALQVATIDGADHFYNGRHDELSREVMNWLNGLGVHG